MTNFAISVLMGMLGGLVVSVVIWIWGRKTKPNIIRHLVKSNPVHWRHTSPEEEVYIPVIKDGRIKTVKVHFRGKQ